MNYAYKKPNATFRQNIPDTAEATRAGAGACQTHGAVAGV